MSLVIVPCANITIISECREYEEALLLKFDTAECIWVSSAIDWWIHNLRVSLFWKNSRRHLSHPKLVPQVCDLKSARRQRGLVSCNCKCYPILPLPSPFSPKSHAPCNPSRRQWAPPAQSLQNVSNDSTFLTALPTAGRAMIRSEWRYIVWRIKLPIFC